MLKKYSIKFLFSLFVIIIFLSGCSQTQHIKQEFGEYRLYEIPTDWADSNEQNNVIDKNSKYLNGKVIFLDPGHGGSDRTNRSKSGNVVEADVNLRVALYLKEYLKQAGAIVKMSREKDVTVKLKERSKMSNNSNAEIFISIHHNASPTYENDWSNYTSTFYHARKGDLEYVAASHDLSRFVQRELAYTMRNSGGLGSFDGTYSDYRIYPNDGFSVLRESNVPAILIECSFFNHINEEKRLQIDEFNQIQAWGIFKGIAKYYFNGVPKIKLLRNESILKSGKLSLVFEVTDITKIKFETTEIMLNGKNYDYTYDEKSGRIFVLLEDATSGDNIIEVSIKNKNGNSNHPYTKTIKIK